MRCPKPLREMPFPDFLAKHAHVLIEMAKWENGAPVSPGTPGWVMARFVMGGLAERRATHDRVGPHSRYHLTEAGRAKVAALLSEGIAA